MFLFCNCFYYYYYYCDDIIFIIIIISNYSYNTYLYNNYYTNSYYYYYYYYYYFDHIGSAPQTTEAINSAAFVNTLQRCRNLTVSSSTFGTYTFKKKTRCYSHLMYTVKEKCICN